MYSCKLLLPGRGVALHSLLDGIDQGQQQAQGDEAAGNQGHDGHGLVARRHDSQAEELTLAEHLTDAGEQRDGPGEAQAHAQTVRNGQKGNNGKLYLR